MQHVLIDACGWVACMDAQLNVEADMEALLGPCTWVLLPSVDRELERLAGTRSGRTRSFSTCCEAKRFAMMAKKRGTQTTTSWPAPDNISGQHSRWTPDSNADSTRPTYAFEVRQNSHLNLVDSL